MAGDASGDVMAAVVPATAGGGPPSLPEARRPAAARRLLRRLAVAGAGTAIVLIGLVLVPLPGPGWAIVFSGVALLSTEFTWAERLLRAVVRRLAPVRAVLARVPQAVRRVVVGLGIAVSVISVVVPLLVLSR